MATYDGQVIETFADQLYRRAVDVIVQTTGKYFFLGCLVIGAADFVLETRVPRDFPLGPISIGAVVVALIAGVLKGRERAFFLKLQAQQLLLQVEIERNTRKA